MACCWANAADDLASPASLLIIDLRSIVHELLFVAFCGLLSDGGRTGQVSVGPTTRPAPAGMKAALYEDCGMVILGIIYSPRRREGRREVTVAELLRWMQYM